MTMPSSKGHKILLTIIDRFTRFPEAIPLVDGSSENVARALVCHWISRFGVPLQITSDRGGQFESAVFRSLTDLLGIKHLRTTPYHPQANGIIERFHRQLKASLLCHGNDWFGNVPIVLLGFRCAFKEDIKSTPAELVYGEALRLPGEVFVPTNKALTHIELLQYLKNRFNKLLAEPTHFHGSRSSFVHKALADCTHVFVRDDRVKTSFLSPYQGPFEVLSRSDKYFTVNVKSSATPISIDRLKSVFLLNEDVNERRVLFNI